MSKKDGPIVVKLVPFGCDPGRLMLGPIFLCPEASAWLRKTFPDGGSFRDAWEQCPDGDWLAYLLRELATKARAPIERRVAMDRLWIRAESGEPADAARAAAPYDEVEGWLRQVMAGRPEVVG